MSQFILGILFTLFCIYALISGILLYKMFKETGTLRWEGKIRWDNLVFCFIWPFFIVKYW